MIENIIISERLIFKISFINNNNKTLYLITLLSLFFSALLICTFMYLSILTIIKSFKIFNLIDWIKMLLEGVHLTFFPSGYGPGTDRTKS